jgi:hypothetical protein
MLTGVKTSRARIFVSSLLTCALLSFGFAARANYWRTVCVYPNSSVGALSTSECMVPDTSEVPADSASMHLTAYAVSNSNPGCGTPVFGHIRACVIGTANTWVCGNYIDQGITVGTVSSFAVPTTVFQGANFLTGKTLEGYANVNICLLPFRINFLVGNI